MKNYSNQDIMLYIGTLILKRNCEDYLFTAIILNKQITSDQDNEIQFKQTKINNQFTLSL